MKDFKIEKVEREDAATISKLAKRSKAYWGYSEELLLSWEENLTITTAYIEKHHLFKYVCENKILAFYALERPEETKFIIEYLFVEPEAIGQGIGRVFVEDIFKRAKDHGVNELELHADPFAEKFYKHLGFERVGEFETPIPGRYLPIMRYLIKPD